MRLVSFSVTNFRSITAAHKLPLNSTTVLIGKNNEGKSNLLRALNLAMRELTSHGGDDEYTYQRDRSNSYIWQRDFPISLQPRRSSTESVFRLEFQLDTEEIADFKSKIKSNLNGNLPIEIKFNKRNKAQIHVPKRGPGGNALSSKSNQIAKYIAERIHFNYIPAVRTEDEALSVVQEMLSVELAELEENEDYKNALQKIVELQQPILEKVSSSIKNSLTLFLPNITDVTVRIPAAARRTALRNQCRIEINDGTNTRLEYKGDGVKSLAALGLLKDKRKSNGASIIAIEEPESHLHPGAMHSLRDVIETLSHNNQLVITTHCPLFVDRTKIQGNILIDGNSARPAKDIASIRSLLGVKASDNLVNASHVLVVEGEEDVTALKAIIPQLSPAIQRAIRSNTLIIEAIGGAGNLPYKLSLLSNALCTYHVLLDNDIAGRTAFDQAEADGLLKTNNTTFIICNGMTDSEMEDCYDPDLYLQDIYTEFGVSLRGKDFRNNKKWSDRVKSCFLTQGKRWSSKVEAQVKNTVSNSIKKSPANALLNQKRSAIDALVQALEHQLKSNE